MMSKGQVSLFFAAGIFAIVLLGVIIYLSYSYSLGLVDSNNDISVLGRQAESLRFFGNKCLKNSIEKAIFEHLGPQGGYIDVEAEGAPFLFDMRCGCNIAYWAKDGKVYNPTLKEVETRLSKFVESEFPDCFDSIIPELYKQGYEINSPPSASVTSTINDKSISVIALYPLVLFDKNEEYVVPQFEQKIDVRFKEIFDRATLLFSNIQKEQPKSYFLNDNCDLYSGNGISGQINYQKLVQFKNIKYFNKPKTLEFNYAIDMKAVGFCG